VLLFLLALAAVPGSVFPQRGLNSLRVRQFFTDHPHLAPVLDRLSLFDVFAAPWFAAIYLLLFTSLAGCVLPRSWRHARAIRARPPSAPRRLDRLPQHAEWTTAAAVEDAAERATTVLRRKHFRVDRTVGDDGGIALAAEKGYLRETGNLVFHLALLVLLAGVALGGLFGYKATRILVQGQAFANTVGAFDSYQPGRLTSDTSLTPFTIGLDRFSASYVRSGPKVGEAEHFDAYVHYSSQPGAPTRRADLRVNHPLTFGSTKVYLVGHGYAPVFRVRDGAGHVVFDGPVPFLPQDGNFGSTGVVKVPDARPQQLGFAGTFLPTAVPTQNGFVSAFPAARNPAVVLLAYRGDLGLDSGVPQSVYTLDDTHLTRVRSAVFGVGDTWTLPHHYGSITFTGLDQWATMQVTYDPGKGLVLIAAVFMVAGLLLSLRVRRRRVWVRVRPGTGGDTVVESGGLGRSDSGTFAEEFTAIVVGVQQVVPVRAGE
jgi:cytochrome c biogenesis protein